MQSAQYMYPSAQYWDPFANLEKNRNNYPPLFPQDQNAQGERGEGNERSNDNFSFGPWGWGDFFGGRAYPHRGPPPPTGDAAGPQGEETNEKEKDKDNDNEEMNDINHDNNGEGPSGNSGSDNEGCAGGRGRHGRCGGRRRGHCGPGGFGGGPGGFGGPWGHRGAHHRGPPHCGPHHGPGPHPDPFHHTGGHHGPRGFGRRGGWGPWSRGYPFGGNFDFSNPMAQFWDQFNDNHASNKDKPTDTTSAEDHKPDADVFDTETAYIVHVSLPGAKKEDVGVNWDAGKSELSVAGVIYRPGDEDFLKTLAMSERKVGAFERKIRLGTMASPPHVDIDGITAKLEDGVLRIEVPKLDAGYVEIRKVDIE